MSPQWLGVIGFSIMIFLMAFRLPVGFAIMLVGIIGFGYLVSFGAAGTQLAKDVFSTLNHYSLSVLPLFMFMGQLVFSTGLSEKIFRTAYKLFGHTPAGLASATIMAAAGFASISGSQLASTATFATVAYPEMKKYKYDLSLASGVVAAGGPLAILIPPSGNMIIYGILTQQSIGKLFMAGIIPGLITTAMLIILIYIRGRLNPRLGPPGPRTSFKEKIVSLSGISEMLILFFLVIGGLFVGWFTPTEAGAAGVGAVMIIALVERRLTWKILWDALVRTTKISSAILIVISGTLFFGRFLAVTNIPFSIVDFVEKSGLSKLGVTMFIILVYFIAGCLVESGPFMMLSLPIFLPLFISQGYDLIWAGVLMTLMVEIGAMTPPVGMSVYVAHGVIKDIPMETIFKGVLPFVMVYLIMVVMLVFIPKIAIFLPSIMYSF